MHYSWEEQINKCYCTIIKEKCEWEDEQKQRLLECFFSSAVFHPPFIEQPIQWPFGWEVIPL